MKKIVIAGSACLFSLVMLMNTPKVSASSLDENSYGINDQDTMHKWKSKSDTSGKPGKKTNEETNEKRWR